MPCKDYTKVDLVEIHFRIYYTQDDRWIEASGQEIVKALKTSVVDAILDFIEEE